MYVRRFFGIKKFVSGCNQANSAENSTSFCDNTVLQVNWKRLLPVCSRPIAVSAHQDIAFFAELMHKKLKIVKKRGYRFRIFQ